MKLKPQHVWWHADCGGPYVVQDERPYGCTLCGSPRAYADMGYRVGQHEGNYSWYSTLESALRDKRTR